MRFRNFPFLIALLAGLSALPAAAPQATPAIHHGMLGGLSWRSIGPAMFAGRVADVAGIPGQARHPVRRRGFVRTLQIHKRRHYVRSRVRDREHAVDRRDRRAARQPGRRVRRHRRRRRSQQHLVRRRHVQDDGRRQKLEASRPVEERALLAHRHPSRRTRRSSWPQRWARRSAPGGERGIYRSTDGGATWTRTLAGNETTGASDVAIDPQDPNIVYAGMYDYQRQPWYFRSGGPGSGLYRSTDGGVSWKKLTDPALKNGLPGAGSIGRVGVSSQPQLAEHRLRADRGAGERRAVAVGRSRHDLARRQQRAPHQQPAVLLHAGARRSRPTRTASTR